MKVTQEKAFAPITIVLETEAEAREMWARLNVSYDTIRREGGLQLQYDMCGMWLEFDRTFSPVKR
jgi:hypothetical protein